MKKVVSFILITLVTALMFAGCGKSTDGNSAAPETTQSGSESQAGSVSVDSLKTFNDIFALNSEFIQNTTYDKTFVSAFLLNDTYYRARADLSTEISEAVFALDIDDEDYNSKLKDLVGDVEIEKIENLNDQILTQEEMDALVGKTGQELLDDGWTWNGQDLATMEFWMYYGPMEYTVVFDGEVPEEEYETYDGEEGMKDMKVKSVTYMGIGDATNIE